MLNWGFRGYDEAEALPPAVRRVQDPVYVEQWGRESVAVSMLSGDWEKKESVNEYLGRGSPCCATTTV